jgi:serine/threonine-protein kinase
VLLRSPTAPADHAVELLQVLGDARTRAIVARDVAALSAVHRTGGPSWASDRQVVEALRAAGTRWEGLRLEVAGATYVPASGTTTAAAITATTATTALVRARVGWTAYTVVTDAGARAARAAQEGDLLDFHLVRGAQGWRIESISRAPAS